MQSENLLSRITRFVRRRGAASGATDERTAPTEVCDQLPSAIAATASTFRRENAAAPGREGTARIGRYELLEGIGRGGMGAVWRAWDHTLERLVALKILDQKLVGDELQRGRFQREARTAAALSDPGICTVHEIGETAEALLLEMDGVPFEIEAGSPFLVMELIEGRTLHDHLSDHGKLEIGEVLDLGVKIANAVGAAHEKGVVHRDLKPSNIMILPGGEVKILDFGLARFIRPNPFVVAEGGPPGGLTKQYTMEGAVVGTISYMSPEQAQGKTLDERSDLFSLGVVLFEMLAGQRPFCGDTPTGTMAKIIEAPPGALDANCPEAPFALTETVGKLLRKQPDDRYASARDLAADLTELRDGLLGDARLPARFRLLRSRRRSTRRIIAASVMGLLALSAVGAWWFGLVPWPSPSARKEFFDDFESVPSPGDDSPWEIFHFDKELWNPDYEQGHLTLWTHQGDTWNENNIGMKAKNLIGIPYLDKHFEVTAKIDDFWPQKDWQQAGIIVFADEDNYVRFTLGTWLNVGLTPPKQVVHVEGVYERRGEVLEFVNSDLLTGRYDGAEPQGPRLVTEGPIEHLWLRLTREDNEWMLRYSYEGVTFFLLDKRPFRLNTTHVGLVAFHGIGHGNGEPDLKWDPIPAKFDFFRLEPLPLAPQ